MCPEEVKTIDIICILEQQYGESYQLSKQDVVNNTIQAAFSSKDECMFEVIK